MALKKQLKTFNDLIEHCTRHGDAQALIDSSTGETLTYSEMCSRVRDLRQKLPEDIPAGARVMLYDLRPLDWVPLFFAVVSRGLVVVPLDTRLSADFIRSAEELTTPALIITGDESVLTSTYRLLKISALKALPAAGADYVPIVDPDAPAEILFTSGTWSRPKGVVLSQHNILANAQQVLAAYDHKPGDVSLAVLPLSHAYQQTAGLVLPLIVGSPVVFLTSLSSRALTAALKKYKVRTMLVVPRVLSLIESTLLRTVGSHALRWYLAASVRGMRFLPLGLRRALFASVHTRLGKDLRTLVVGGAPLPPELDHFFQGLGYRVLVGYGASECAPTISISTNQRRAAGEVGKPLPGVALEINDKGELLVRGENIFLGYWPDINRPSFFNTEDVAVAHSDGSYRLKGRTKNLVIYPSGDKIFCEDVEQIVCQQPGVEDCCVVGVASDSGVQLWCALRGDDVLKGSEESIQQRVNKQLPFGVRLDKILFLEQAEFPYTHTLKPNRQKILALCTTSASASPLG